MSLFLLFVLPFTYMHRFIHTSICIRGFECLVFRFGRKSTGLSSYMYSVYPALFVDDICKELNEIKNPYTHSGNARS